MVKLLLLFSLLYLVLGKAYAINDWSSLAPGKSYILKDAINISGPSLKLEAGTKLRLVEKSDLNMIKVKHFKYKINNCKNYGELAKKESAIELVSTGHEASVGVNVAKNCILEVYVQESDSQKQTFFI